MISDDGLYRLAVFFGSAAMLLIILYHFLEVNSVDEPESELKAHTKTTSPSEKSAQVTRWDSKGSRKARQKSEKASTYRGEYKVYKHMEESERRYGCYQNPHDVLAVYSTIGQHQILYNHVTTSGGPKDVFEHISDRRGSWQHWRTVPTWYSRDRNETFNIFTALIFNHTMWSPTMTCCWLSVNLVRHGITWPLYPLFISRDIND